MGKSPSIVCSLFRISRTLFSVMIPAIIATGVCASSQLKTVRATAVASDRESAIVLALSDALRQVHGGEISTSREASMMLRRVVQDGRRTSNNEKHVATRTSSTSGGLISGYRLVSVSSDSYGGVRATLDVDVPIYKVNNVHSERRRVAVYPVEAAASSYRFGSTALAAGEVSERLTQSIVSMLVQSRRFSVLDRDMRKTIEREHGFLGRADVPLSEKMAIGHTLGADFLMINRLREVSLTTTRTKDPYTGNVRQNRSGQVVLESRVVMPSTGQLMWSKTENMGADEFSNLTQAQTVLDDIAKQVVRDMLETIYPLRVIDGLGATAVISQGGDLLQLGERFEVFEIGRRYADPYHGESLGARERRVATVETTFIGAKTSTVKVLDGRVEGDGHVLRKIPSLGAGRPAYNQFDRNINYGPSDSYRRSTRCLPGDLC